MSDPRDYKLDIRGSGNAPSAPSGPGEDASGVRPPAPPADGSRGASSAVGRPYLSVHFACCGIYQRVYREPDGKTYQGRCPRCATPVRFIVGQGGTAARTFVVR